MPNPQQPIQPPPAPPEVDLDGFEDILSSKLRIPRNLLRGMTSAESGGNTEAVSPVGARGRYQVMPTTFEEAKRRWGMPHLDQKNPFDNAYVGARYLRERYDQAPQYRDDRARWADAVSRYHGGGTDAQGNVRTVSDGGITTDKHVDRVLKKWADYERSLAGSSEPVNQGTINQSYRVQRPAPAPGAGGSAPSRAAMLGSAPQARAASSATPAASETNPRRAQVLKTIEGFEQLKARTRGDDPVALRALQEYARGVQQEFPELQVNFPDNGWPNLAAKDRGLHQYIVGTNKRAWDAVRMGLPAPATTSLMQPALEEQAASNIVNNYNATLYRLSRSKKPADQQQFTQAVQAQEGERVANENQARLVEQMRQEALRPYRERARQGVSALNDAVRPFTRFGGGLMDKNEQGDAAEELAPMLKEVGDVWSNKTDIRESARRLAASAEKGLISLPQGVASLADTVVDTNLRMYPGDAAANALRNRTPFAEHLQPWTQTAKRRIEADYGVNPSAPNTVGNVVAEGLGSTVPFVVGGAAGMGAKGAALLGAAQNAQSTYEEARAHQASPRQAALAARYGAAIGLTEAAGVAGQLQKLGLSRQVITRVLDAAEEGGQELVQQVLNNVNAAHLSGYDKSRRTLDGVALATLGGLLTGGVFQAGGAIASGARQLSGGTGRLAVPEALGDFAGEMGETGARPAPGGVTDPGVMAQVQATRAGQAVQDWEQFKEMAAQVRAEQPVDGARFNALSARLSQEMGLDEGSLYQLASADDVAVEDSPLAQGSPPLAPTGQATNSPASPASGSLADVLQRGRQQYGEATGTPAAISATRADSRNERQAAYQETVRLREEAATQYATALEQQDSPGIKAALEQERDAIRLQTQFTPGTPEQVVELAQARRRARQIDQELRTFPSAPTTKPASRVTTRSTDKSLGAAVEPTAEARDYGQQLLSLVSPVKAGPIEVTPKQYAQQWQRLQARDLGADVTPREQAILYDQQLQGLERPVIEETSPATYTPRIAGLAQKYGLPIDVQAGTTAAVPAKANAKTASTTARPALPLRIGSDITRDPEYQAQQQRMNDREGNLLWTQRAAETNNRRPSEQEQREDVSPIALIRRAFVTINPGAMVGEARWAREGGVHGLLSKKAKYTINDARELLRDSNYRMPDGRAFDDSVYDDEVLEYLVEHGTTARPESVSQRAMDEQLAEEEESYLSNKSARPEDTERARLEDLEARAGGMLPERSYEARRLAEMRAQETAASVEEEPSLERSAPTDDEIEAMNVAEMRDRFASSQQFIPSTDARADAAEALDEIDLLDRRRVQEEQRRRAGVREAAPVGDYGKLSRLARRPLAEGMMPLAEHSDWKRVLEVTPDATAQEMLDAIAQDLAGVERSSMMSPQHWLDVLSRFAGDWSAELKDLVSRTLAASEIFSQRRDAFLADAQVQALLNAPIPPRGFAQRVRDLQARATQYNGAQNEPSNITKHWIEETLKDRGRMAGGRTESDRTDAARGDEPRAETQSEAQAANDRSQSPQSAEEPRAAAAASQPDRQDDPKQSGTQREPVSAEQNPEQTVSRTIAHQQAQLDGAKVVAETPNHIVVAKTDGTETLVKKDSAHLKKEGVVDEVKIYFNAERQVGDQKDGPSLGIFLAPDRAIANKYAGRKGKVRAYQVSIQNPLRLTADDSIGLDEASVEHVNRQLQEAGIQYEFEDYDPQEIWRYFDDGGKKFINAVKKAGYDAIVYTDAVGAKAFDSLLVFDRSKAKEVAEEEPVTGQTVASVTSSTGQTSAKPPREFASTQVDITGDLAQKLLTFGQTIPDSELAEDGREDKPHITVKFGLHDDAPNALRELLASEKPITAKLGKVSIFAAKEGSDFDVVKVDIESPDLHRLNQKIADARPVTDTHPTYKPHVTIAYVKPGEGQKYVGDATFEGQEVTFDSVTFSGKNREKIAMPLTGEVVTPDTALLRKPESPLPRSTATQERSISELLGELEKNRAPELTEKERAAVENRRAKYVAADDPKLALDIANLGRLLGGEDIVATAPDTAPLGIVIEDFGEKIGGARKDTAQPLGSRASTNKPADDRPAWRRKYSVSQIAGSLRKSEVGKWSAHREGDRGIGKVFDTKEEAEAAIPLLEVARKHRVHNIAKRGETPNYAIYRNVASGKYPNVKEGFATAEEAQLYIAIHPEEIIEHKFQEPIRPWLDSITRVGTERRQGNIDPKQLQNDFAFRGGEFGNWNQGGDGQAVVNYAYDAMHDLVEVLDLPPNALSLGGQLSVAFGARGHGGKDAAAAHYERSRAVINLTKIKGAGTFAHEWFHAVDHYTAQLDGKSASERQADGTFPTKGREEYATHGFSWKSKAQKELAEAFKNLVRTMTKKSVEQRVEATKEQQAAERQAQYVVDNLKSLREQYLRDDSRYNKRYKKPASEDIARWDALSEQLISGEFGDPVKVETKSRWGSIESFAPIVEMDALYKKSHGRGLLKADPDSYGRRLTAQVREMMKSRERVGQAAQGATEVKTVGTDFYDNARDLDRTRVSDYYTTPHEMGARAFEAYIYDKIREQGKRSDYLVYGVENKYYLEGKPYPEGAERQQINEAFDRFFEVARKLNQESGYLSKAAADARQRLSNALKGNQVNDVTGVVRDLAIVGAEQFYRGAQRFSQWSAALREEFSARLEPYLAKAWEQMQTFWRDETGALNERKLIEKIKDALIKSGIAEPLGQSENDLRDADSEENSTPLNTTYDIGGALYAAGKWTAKKLGSEKLKGVVYDTTTYTRKVSLPAAFNPTQWLNAVEAAAQKISGDPDTDAHAARLLTQGLVAVSEQDGGRFAEVNEKLNQLMRERKIKLLSTVGDAQRTLSAGGEFSYLLRQGRKLAFTNFKSWAKAAPELLRASLPYRQKDVTGNKSGTLVLNGAAKQRYFNTLAEIKADSLWPVAEKAGIDVAALNESDFNASILDYEENVATGPLRQLPVLKQLERGNKAFMAKLMFSAFKQNLERTGLAGTTVADLEKKTKQGLQVTRIAGDLNVLSGRADLSDWQQSFVRVTSTVGFSPRYVISNFQTLNRYNPAQMLRYFSIDKKGLHRNEDMVSRQRAKDAAKMTAYYLSLLALSSVGVATGAFAIDWDDPDDPDFLKLKVGKARYDLPLVGNTLRFVLRLAKRGWEAKEQGWEPVGKAGQQTGAFLRQKESPLVSLVHDQIVERARPNNTVTDVDTGEKVRVGRNAIGEIKTVKESLVERGYPMTWQAFVKAIQSGESEDVIPALAEAIGVGAQAYESRMEKLSGNTKTRLTREWSATRGYEPQIRFQSRVQRAEDLYKEFAPQLLEMDWYSKATPEQRVKAETLLTERIEAESYKERPDRNALSKWGIVEAVRRSEQSTITRRKNDDKSRMLKNW